MIDEVDEKMSENNGRSSLENSLVHQLNPMHYYCRLIEHGMDRKMAMVKSQIYEATLWQRLMEVMYERMA